MADDVQPQQDEGQGDGSEGGIFAPYLEAVPESWQSIDQARSPRDTIAEYLKNAEKNVNERISKASEIEKTLGPYREFVEKRGKQYPPDVLDELAGWHEQTTATPEAFDAWFADLAKERGWTQQEAEEAVDDAVDSGEVSRDELQKLVAEQAQERVQPLEQRFSEWEEKQQIESTEADIRRDLAKLEADEGVKLTEAQQKRVLRLGMEDESEDWVKHGFEEFREITTEGQRAFVADKTGTPGTPLGAGGVPAFTPTTDFKEASQQLRERLRQQS